MADINDRLERLSRREEFARRTHRGGLLPAAPDVDLDDDFAEVLAAVARVVQRHPGLSVMVAPADGRPGRTVIRVTERDGAVETAVVAPPVPPRPPAPAVPPAPREEWIAEPASGGRHSDERFRLPAAAPPIPPADQPRPGYQERPPSVPTRGLVTLTDETSQVVARLAQMLREDPSLASGWVRDR
ncbi:MAG: hypothetical protein V7637_5450 [Mycobacteriales bacterium]